jgi:formylglycine-generating enzyme required for sulfatase activity
LKSLWREVINPMIPLVAQTGAQVYFKPYDVPESAWVYAGTSPIETPQDAPKGVLRIRIEKQGFVTGEFAVANPGPSLITTDDIGKLKVNASVPDVPLVLAREGELADDMVLVPDTSTQVYLLGWSRNVLGDHKMDIPRFAIGRHEVTNAEFKQFVDAGGYGNQTYWQGFQYVAHGHPITVEQAKALMVDQTGRPGPAGWTLGSHANGEGDMPVGGISWYEAVAYAR